MVPAQIWSVWALILILVVIAAWARLGGGEPGDDTWSAMMDLPLAALSGIGFAAASVFLLAPSFLVGGFDTDAELPVYCSGLGAMRAKFELELAGKLSPLAAVLLLPLSNWFGVLPSLVIGAIASSAVFGAGIFVWARAAGGRLAGVVAVAFAATNHHLALLVRTPSFYPETTALNAVGIAAVAVALRWRTPGKLFVGACGAGLLLATDTRALAVGLWATGLVGIAAIAAPIRQWPRRIALMAAPIVASWFLTGALYDAVLPGELVPSGLVIQSGAFLRDIPGYPAALAESRDLAAYDFTWGVLPLTRIPGALLKVAELTKHVPPEWLAGGEVEFARRAWIFPWLPLYVGAMVAAIATMWRRPWALVAGLAPCVVFVANLTWVMNTLPMGRFLTLGMCSVPIVFALGTVGLGGQRWPIRPAVTLVLFLGLAAIGALPTYLSPWATWRTPDCAPGRLVAMSNAMRAGSPVALGPEGDILPDPNTPVCLGYAAADHVAGKESFLPPDIPGKRDECGLPPKAGFWVYLPGPANVAGE